MSIDIIAPTAEQLRKGAWDKPALDRKTVRRYYRRITTIDRARRAEQIDEEQLQAHKKLEKHFYGAMGVDVGDEDSRHDDGQVVEYSTTYHSQKLAQARSAVTTSEWTAQLMLIESHATMEDIGRRLEHWPDAKMCRGYGLAVCKSGLDRLVKLWGLKSEP